MRGIRVDGGEQFKKTTVSITMRVKRASGVIETHRVTFDDTMPLKVDITKLEPGDVVLPPFDFMNQILEGFDK